MPERTIGKLAVAAAASVVVIDSANAYADVTISTAQTQNMGCANGICAPTAASAVLNVGDLETLLASGNVEVTTTGSNGTQASNVDVDAALTWSSTNSFALDAYQSITVNQAISVTNQNAVSFTTDDGGSGGLLSFGTEGSMSFANLSSPLTINGTNYTLVNTINSLASDIASNPGGAYAFASNYDASQSQYSDSPIPTTLAGTVEGLGNTISNLTMVHTNRRLGESLNVGGLFDEIGPSGTVENLTTSNTNVRDERSGRYVGFVSLGGMVGLNEGLLSGDRVDGIVKLENGQSAGGLVGSSLGTITASHVDVKVTCYQGINKHLEGCYSGGLVGFINGNQGGGAVNYSSADGKVIAQAVGTAVGGLVGYSYFGTISYSSATATLGAMASESELPVGGLIGFAYSGSVSESFATGSFAGAGNFWVGGLIGSLEYTSIANSYATGDTSGSVSGGLVGVGSYGDYSLVTTEYSYSTGKVGGTTFGGFVGANCCVSDLYADCYWDTTTTGTDEGAGSGTDSGITGLTTKQLKSGLPAGFDSSIWAENPSINKGLPYLIANPPPQ